MTVQIGPACSVCRLRMEKTIRENKHGQRRPVWMCPDGCTTISFMAGLALVEDQRSAALRAEEKELVNRLRVNRVPFLDI